MEVTLLSKAETLDYCARILIPKGAAEILGDITEKIVQDTRLFEIYEEFYLNYIDSGHRTTVWEKLNIHLYVEEVLGKQASLFNLHAALKRLPLAEKKYRELGIGEDIFLETPSQTLI